LYIREIELTENIVMGRLTIGLCPELGFEKARQSKIPSIFHEKISKIGILRILGWTSFKKQ
jgi:hypothetical protein